MSKHLFERETQEFQPVRVVADGAILTDFEVAVVPRGDRPLDWQLPVQVEGQVGVMIVGLGPGPHEVFVRITDLPEIPVVSAGIIWIQ